MSAFQVKNGPTSTIEFDGRLLAEVSSRRAAPRWTELRLYETDSGVFLLESVGVSIVLHAPGCPDIVKDIPRFQAEFPGEDPSGGKFWYCETCAKNATDMTALLVESNRYSASYSEHAGEIIEELYRHKGGARSLPPMSLELLEAASEVSEPIALAFRVQRIN